MYFRKIAMKTNFGQLLLSLFQIWFVENNSKDYLSVKSELNWKSGKVKIWSQSVLRSRRNRRRRWATARPRWAWSQGVVGGVQGSSLTGSKGRWMPHWPMKKQNLSKMKPSWLEWNFQGEPDLKTQVWGVGVLYVVSFPVLLVMLVVGAIRVRKCYILFRIFICT